MSAEITISYAPNNPTGILKFIHTFPLNDSMEDIIDNTLDCAFTKGVNTKVSVYPRNNN